MKELISIAFSAINKRLEELEKKFQNFEKNYEETFMELSLQKVKIEDLEQDIQNMLVRNYDEVEEYKFGKQ